MRILVTGGAGFIGTHFVRRALMESHDITILDNFNPQIHQRTVLPIDIAAHVRLIVGDIADKTAVQGALVAQDAVVHLAAETGTGQSMYNIRQYERVNGMGTANVLECLVDSPDRTVSKIVVASSRAVYGEGKYRCSAHGVVYPGLRDPDAMLKGQFEPTCPECKAPCVVMPTDECAPVSPVSYYGLTKFVQERGVTLFARALEISGYALRFQNVFGPGQSLCNPYTGILAVFSNLARSNLPINIFEDGRESRDFVYVTDAVEAIFRCLHPANSGCGIYNVGTSVATSVADVATKIKVLLGSSSVLSVSGAFRKGDIRHSIADPSKAKADLGFVSTCTFDYGLQRFLDWALGCKAENSKYEHSLEELRVRGLMRG